MADMEAGRATRWTARPWIARLIRAFVHLAPLAVSIAAASPSAACCPSPNVSMAVARWLLIAAASTVLLALVDKLARRLLPLATLFGLTLAFPDQAPSRFRIALRTGSTAQLRKRLVQARAADATLSASAITVIFR